MTAGFLIASLGLGIYMLIKEIFKRNETKGGDS